MTGKILIAYTTRMGSTAEIAQAIARALTAAGKSAEVAELKAVTTLAGYSAVVIGSPVYLAKVEKDVASFVAGHREALLKMPVTAFAVGIAPVDSRVGSVEDILGKLRAALDPVKPVAVTVFAGRLDLSRMSFLQRTLTGAMKVLTGDFRDWDAIEKWAKELSAFLPM